MGLGTRGLGDSGMWDAGTRGRGVAGTPGRRDAGTPGRRDDVGDWGRDKQISLNLLSTIFGALEKGIIRWRVCQ